MNRQQCNGIVGIVYGSAFIMHQTEIAWQLLGLLIAVAGYITLMTGAPRDIR